MKTATKIHFTVLMTVLLSVIFISAFAQERKREINVGTQSFNQFNVRYKFGNEKRMFRIYSGLLNYEHSKHAVIGIDDDSFGVGLGAGIEFPKMVNDKIQLYYGFSVGGSFNNITDNFNRFYTVQSNVILGSAYFINEYVKIGIEIAPAFYYTNSKVSSITERFGFSGSTNVAEISLGFVF